MSVRQALTQLIQHDIERGTLPTGFDGRIVRRGYAKALSLSKSAMTYYTDVFTHFESSLGIVDRIGEVLPRIKSHFLKLLDEQRLKTTNGHVSRAQLLKPFDLYQTSAAKRDLRLRELLNWCDAEIAHQAYLSPSVREMIERCRTALSTGAFDDTSAGRVSNRSLRLHLGLPGDGAYPDYLKDVIDEHETAIRKSLDDDPLVVTIRHKRYSVREFISEGWSERVLATILGSFVDEFSHYNSKRVHILFRALIRLLWLISSHREASCNDLFLFLNEGTRVEGAARSLLRLSKILEADLHHSSPSPHTVNHFVDATNLVLALMARRGALPCAVKISRKKLGHAIPRRTILEIHAGANPHTCPEAAEDNRLQTLIAFANEKLGLATADVLAHLDESDTEAFLETLRLEVSSLSDEVMSNPVKAMLQVIETRDSILKRHFISLINKWKLHFFRGQELWADGVDPELYWNDDFISNRTSTQVSDIFPDDIDRRDIALANLLRLVREKFGGFIPNYSCPDASVRRFFARICSRFGGRGFLMAYLFPHKDWVGSVTALYLLGSGANVAVGLSLAADCIRDSDEEGYRIVHGNKEKAGGKPIVIYLEECGEAMSAMLGWQLARPAFSHLGEGVLSKFFVAREKGGKVQPVTDAWFLEWFKSQTGSLPYFAERGIRLVPSILRPTLLLRAVLDQNGETRHAITLAQHTSKVYASYYARFPIRLMHEIDQRLFQQIMETIAVHKHPAGAAFIGLSQAEFDRRLEEFEPTGFGLRCGNPYGHPRRQGQLCNTFDCWRCEKGIMIVEPEDVAALIQWDRALASDEGEWVRDHPERWNEYFLGWQIYIEHVAKTMQEQPHLVSIWEEGTLLAEAAMADPAYRPIRPWN